MIKYKLIEKFREHGYGCFSVTKLAAELGMDQRTVRDHLKILELDNFGVFVDPDGREFCTREGISLIAKKLGLTEKAEQGRELKEQQ